MYYHWRQIIRKSRAAANLIYKVKNLHDNVIRYGTTTNLHSGSNEPNIGQEGSCQECLRKMVIMPDSNFKIFWNLVTIVLLIYTAIFVPYNVAFSDSNERSLA